MHTPDFQPRKHRRGLQQAAPGMESDVELGELEDGLALWIKDADIMQGQFTIPT